MESGVRLLGPIAVGPLLPGEPPSPTGVVDVVGHASLAGSLVAAFGFSAHATITVLVVTFWVGIRLHVASLVIVLFVGHLIRQLAVVVEAVVLDPAVPEL